VFVFNGTYIGYVGINKSIDLIGEDKNTTIIIGYFAYTITLVVDWINVSGFTIHSNARLGEGVRIDSNHNILKNNIIETPNDRVRISGNNNTITKNTFACDSIYLAGYSNTISENTISNVDCGIIFTKCCNNKISNNSFFNSGLFITEDNNCNNLIIDNTVNGKPLVYLYEESERIINNDAGQIILENCINITVQNQYITDTNIGIQLWRSDYCKITDNTFADNHFGIYINGKNNLVERNSLENNRYGLWIFHSSLDNIIYHNNLLNNTLNAIDAGQNFWDNGYPTGGNFWDDYLGADSDRNGIGDSPYNISGGNNQDSYPFIEPNGWFDNIEFGPYPQNPTRESIVIVWATDTSTKNNSVSFGLTAALGNIVYENTSNDFHEIKLTGLAPSTKYYYTIKSEDFESKIYCFYTASKENDSIRFIAFGDTRGVWDDWKNASIVAEAIEKEDPQFVIHTGDLVRDGRVYEQWLDYFKISSFVHNSTLFPTLGNHERFGDPYFDYFNLPNNEIWYSFNWGPVHFVCLDSNFLNSLRPAQFFWLIKDLKLNSKPYTIVNFHNPPYSSGNHGSSYYLRLIWGPIFQYFNVDIIFNGHDHSYEHGKVKDVNYIVTGGGGAPLYDVGSSRWTIYSEKTYHYCLIEANQQQLSFKAKKSDGTIIDSFVIS